MKKFLLLALLMVLPSMAAELPAASSGENMALKYEARWNGIKIAEMRLFLNEQPGSYSYQALIDTVGLYKSISKYWGINIAKGRIIGSKYFPSSFETKWQPKKTGVQRIVVNYTKDGTASETATPLENRKKRPEIAQKDKKNVPDPITAAVQAHKKISQIISSKLPLPQDFSVRAFDSRRVFDLNFSVKGYEPYKLGSKVRKLLRVRLTRTPIAGFSDKELAKERKEGMIFDIYVDDNAIPLAAQGNLGVSQATIRLAKSCAGADCKL